MEKYAYSKKLRNKYKRLDPNTKKCFLQFLFESTVKQGL